MNAKEAISFLRTFADANVQKEDRAQWDEVIRVLRITHLQVLALRSLIQSEKAKIEQEIDTLKNNLAKPIDFDNPGYLTENALSLSLLEGKLLTYLYTYAVIFGPEEKDLFAKPEDKR